MMTDVCAQVSIIDKRHGMTTMYRDLWGGGAGEVKEGTGAGGGGLGGWGVAYQCPSSTPISTGSRQASRWGDAPTMNPAKTARASLESAFLCTVCQGKGAGRGAEGKRLL